MTKTMALWAVRTECPSCGTKNSLTTDATTLVGQISCRGCGLPVTGAPIMVSSDLDLSRRPTRRASRSRAQVARA